MNSSYDDDNSVILEKQNFELIDIVVENSKISFSDIKDDLNDSKQQ